MATTSTSERRNPHQKRLVRTLRKGVDMKSWSFRRAVLALGVGLAVITGLVRAQEPRPLPAPGGTAPSAPAPTMAVTADTSLDSLPHAPAKHSRLHDCLHRHGLHCTSNERGLGCGSWKSDCKFVFGSCREFFGEECIPQPPSDHRIFDHGKGSCGCQ
jgi:hypothetical protein